MTQDKREVTIELTEVNYGHLREIAQRFKDRGIEHMSTVEQIIHYCISGSFHALDVESYDPKTLAPVTVGINGVIALPPDATANGDLRGCGQLIMHRVNNAFPFNLLHVNISAPSKRSKKIEEWRDAIQTA